MPAEHTMADDYSSAIAPPSCRGTAASFRLCGWPPMTRHKFIFVTKPVPVGVNLFGFFAAGAKVVK